MAGRDITESLPVNIGNPGTSGFWTNTQEDYDVAIGGLPFFMVPTDQNPYQRETAPYRKDQLDNSKEPGEQSLTGWWLRSQSSFHVGTGINFYDPSGGEVSPYRFHDSQNVNVWTKGEVTLLNGVFENHITTGAITANKNSQQHLRSINYSNTDGVLLHDEYDVDKLDSAGNITHFIDYNAGVNDKVFAICDDGIYAYWVTNDTGGGAGKLRFYKKLLTGVSGAGDILMFSSPSITVTTACMEFVKDRIVAVINNVTYEIAPNATVLPTAVYTNPNVNWIATSITASGPAIYISGNSGIYSTIHKYTLSTSGAMPTLTQAVVSAELPPGEVCYKIYHYLGRMMIGTNKGVRVADINDQDGSLSYGPLLFETSQPCYDFAARDRFVWCATGIGSLDAGLIRIDLGTTVEGETITGGYANQLRFAYANDIQYVQTTTHYTTAVAFFGSSNTISFATAYNGTNGHFYRETPGTLASSGYITTGAIRYGTLEPKNFKFVRARGDYSFGAMDIQTIKSNNDIYNVITYNSAVGTPEAATTQPEGSHEYLSYKFTLSRSASDNSKGPVFKGYQVKALPATARQRLIQFPLWCFDIETDRYNVKTGYEGRAWERIQLLEDIEKSGDIINIQDFTTGERVQAVIERTAFARRTPPNGNYSGFGGILTVLVRTVL